MTLNIRTRYTPYIGNVTRQDPGGHHRDKVMWQTGEKVTEASLAAMLQNAYDLGRKEAVLDMQVALEGVKK